MAMFVNVNPNFKSELMRTVQSPRDEILEYLDIAYGLADSAVDVLQGSTSELSSDFLLKLESTKITINETASKLNLIVNYLKKNPSLHLVRIVLFSLCLCYICCLSSFFVDSQKVHQKRMQDAPSKKRPHLKQGQNVV